MPPSIDVPAGLIAFLDETGDSGRLIDGRGRLRGASTSRAFAVGGVVVPADRWHTLERELLRRADQYYPDGFGGEELKGSELLGKLSSRLGKDRDTAEKYLSTILSTLARNHVTVAATLVLKDGGPECPSKYALVRQATLATIELVEDRCSLSNSTVRVEADQHYHSSSSQSKIDRDLRERPLVMSVTFIDSKFSPMVRVADQVISCAVMAVARASLEWPVQPIGGFYVRASGVGRDRSRRLADRLHRSLERLTIRSGTDASIRVIEGSARRERPWPLPSA